MSQFKRKLTAFTAMLAFLSLSSAATYAISAGDVLGNTGNVGISQGGNRLDVDINSGVNGAVGQVDWGNFNVGKNEHVNFGFSGLSQTIINRVLGGNESQILGKLTNSCIGGGSCDSFAATSKVILINPAGIMFGPGSTVDLNSFTVSTFDFKGAKNLKDMSEADLTKYQTGVLNKISPMASGNNGVGNITFDSNYTEAFKDAGIDVQPGASVVLDGTTFAHFNPDGTISDANPNKSVAIVADNIKYKDSLIRTGQNYNYISPNNNQSFSNVRLVTADGVTFGYLANGYADNYEVADDTKSDVVRNIEMDNSGLAADTEAIKSGDVHIINKSNAEGSNIKIANSVIKGTKLINKENGDIMIVGSHDVDIDKSRLESVNTEATLNGIKTTTENQNGGEIFVSGGKNVNVKDSLIISAGAKSGTANDTNAGAVRVYSYGGDVNLDNTKVLAKGDAKIIATDKVTTNNSLIQAYNTVDESKIKNVKISGADGVKIHNTVVDAAGNIDVLSAYSDGTLSGDVIISSDLDSNNQNQTLVVAGDKLSVQGKNTLIDNASLVYEDIKFYGDGTSGLNNVTVANNSTFSPVTTNSEGKKVVGGDINLETNGDFTLDNATVKRAAYTLKFDRNADDSLVDDGTANAINYKVTLNTADANNVNIKSTQGNVNAINNTNVHANNDITLTSDTKDVNVKGSALKADRDVNLIANNNLNVTSDDAGKVDSEIHAGRDANLLAKNGNVTVNAKGKQGKDTVKAGQNANIEATNGAVYLTDNTKVIADKDVNVKAHDTITFGSQGANGINIDSSADLTAMENMNIVSTAGDINAEKTTMPTLSYGDRLTFNANGSNNFTSEDSLKSVNVDYIAGKSNNFTTKGDIQFVNSSLESPNNNITTTTDGDVIMNNLTIKQATEQAKDTVTKINAKGNVTTKDVTKSVADDTKESMHKFPQSVEYNENGTATDNQILDINQTKLIVNTKTEITTPQNNTNGSIIIDIKNADNKEAGIELTAENTQWDEQIGPNEGPEVHINAVDDKLSVSKIVTDKLFTDANDKMYAAPVDLTPEQLAGLPEGTPSKGYIEVRDYGGFNQDNDFTKDPDDFDYTGSYVPGKVTTPDGEIDVNHKHTINFGDTDEDFILVYDRPTNECPPLPDVDPDDTPIDDNIDSLINQIKIPREQVEISKTSKVSDNTVDQTSNIMSAAAKVDLGQDNNKDTEKEDEKND